jgi:hypothetical protein
MFCKICYSNLFKVLDDWLVVDSRPMNEITQEVVEKSLLTDLKNCVGHL